MGYTGRQLMNDGLIISLFPKVLLQEQLYVLFFHFFIINLFCFRFFCVCLSELKRIA